LLYPENKSSFEAKFGTSKSELFEFCVSFLWNPKDTFENFRPIFYLKKGLESPSPYGTLLFLPSYVCILCKLFNGGFNLELVLSMLLNDEPNDDDKNRPFFLLPDLHYLLESKQL